MLDPQSLIRGTLSNDDNGNDDDNNRDDGGYDDDDDWYLLGSPLAAVKAAAILPGVHMKQYMHFSKEHY